MAIGVLLELPGVTQDQYEQVVSGLTGGGSLDSLSDWPVPGVLAHVAGPTGAGWRVVDVWESEEAFRRFGEQLMPQMQAAGLPPVEPDFFPVYRLVRE